MICDRWLNEITYLRIEFFDNSENLSVLIWNSRDHGWDWMMVMSAILIAQCYAQYGMRNANMGITLTSLQINRENV